MGGRPRLALIRAIFHDGAVQPEKPKRPWAGFGYLILLVIALLVALFLVWPLGQEVRSVFQRLTEAFRDGK